MEIRPHHVLCAHFFIGKGYDEQFVEHMKKTLAALNHSGAAVTLTSECDELCRQCPNNQNGVCDADCKVRAIDRRVIEALWIHFGETVLWSDLYLLAERRILEPGMLKDVCRDCEWIALCKAMCSEAKQRLVTEKSQSISSEPLLLGLTE